LPGRLHRDRIAKVRELGRGEENSRVGKAMHYIALTQKLILVGFLPIARKYEFENSFFT